MTNNGSKHNKLVTTPEISQRMKHVKTKKGLSEVMLSRALWHKGFRYRLNYKRLPGCPDIAITKYKIAIFVDGEFWHGYYWEDKKTRLKSNREYWIAKIEKNIVRDIKNDQLLILMGWSVLHFGDKEVKKHLDKCVSTVIETIHDSLNTFSDDMYIF